MAGAWNDLITQSFIDLDVIQPGETISSAMQADAQTRLNQLIGSLSAEGLTVHTQTAQTFNLQPGVTQYTLGAGGSFPTSARVHRATAWRANYGNVLASGGRVLSPEEFGSAAAAAQPSGETTPVPRIVGADAAYPLVNVRVLPPPSNVAGTLELFFWLSVPQIADFTAAYNLPDEWPDMLHYNLAVRLAPIYARQGGISQELAANAQNTKASIVAQNQHQPQQQ